MTTQTTNSAAFHELIDPSAQLSRLGTGFDFIEGPVWHPLARHLLFSDIPGDVRRRWSHEEGVIEVARPSEKGNGMAYDAEMNLLVCEHSTSQVVRLSPDGSREVLASHFEGRELNSPNDLCVQSDGSIYFSDPWYGRMPGFGVERPRQLGWQGVFKIPAGGGEPQLLVERGLFTQPNGLCFSPSEDRLYVNDTVQANIRVFDVMTDGFLGPGRVFASEVREANAPGLPDGMKCDSVGNVWVTGPGGVWVFDPDGRHIGRLCAPEEVANLCWGGDDGYTLFLAATHSLFAVTTRIGSRLEAHMRR